MGDEAKANGDSATKEREVIGPRRIGMCEGFDLVARVVKEEGWYGSLRGAGLPELGPFSDEARTVEALSRVASTHRRYGCDPTRTLGSAEYITILHDYCLANQQEKDR